MEENNSINEVREENGLEPVKKPKHLERMTMDEVIIEENGLPPVEQPKLMIPVHILAICGDQNTPAELRLSYSQVAFVTPEQYQLINLRLNDMANTINGFINENNKEG